MTESRILQWIQEQNQAHSRVSGDMIKERARTFYQKIASQCAIVPHPFSASDGWLSDFCKRNDLHSYKIYGESAQVDKDQVDKFKLFLDATIKMEDYAPEQIWNFDETGLNWVKFPERTFSSKADSKKKELKGQKDEKPRVTLLLGK